MTELSHIWQWKLTQLTSGRCTNGVNYCLLFCSYLQTIFRWESLAYNQIWEKRNSKGYKDIEENGWCFENQTNIGAGAQKEWTEILEFSLWGKFRRDSRSFLSFQIEIWAVNDQISYH